MKGAAVLAAKENGPWRAGQSGPRTGTGNCNRTAKPAKLKRAAKQRTRLSVDLCPLASLVRARSLRGDAHIKMHIPVCTTFEGRRKTKPPCVRQTFEMGMGDEVVQALGELGLKN
uniref:Uncharacterized protein n=1 Tax=Anopheles melas TaxID=34690 RepID=A0A182TQL8_9DIPT